MADFFGRKNVLILSLTAYIFSFIFFYLGDRYSFFLFCMVLFGIGEAFRSGTHKAMILDYLKQQELLEFRTQYYGSVRSWSQLGSAVSSLIAMLFVVYTENYRSIFLFSAVPYIVDVFIIASYPGYLNGERKRIDPKSFYKNTVSDFRKLAQLLIENYRKGSALPATFSIASYIAFFKAIKDYLQPILESVAFSLPLLLAWSGKQRTAVIIGVVYFFVFILTSLSSRNAWRIEKYFSEKTKSINVLYLTGVGAIFLSGFFLRMEVALFAVLSFLILYIIQNLRRPIAVGYIAEVIDSKILASGLSLESQIQTLIVMVTAPLLGYLCDHFDVGGGLMVIGLIFLLIYPLVKLKKGN